MRKIGKIMLIAVESILLFIVVGALTTASVKNVQKIVLVEKFKSKAVYQESISNDTIKYYKVASDDEALGYTMVNGVAYPGNTGDIVCSTTANLIHPIISGVVTFFAGGHAGLCTDDYSDYLINLNNTKSIEASGTSIYGPEANAFTRDYWVPENPTTEVIGLRVKMTDRECDEVLSYATSYIGEMYNYSFLFNTNHTIYCTDLISNSFNKIGKNLNKDGFTTSVYDLVVSSDTYISYYHYFKDGVKYIYYLG